MKNKIITATLSILIGLIMLVAVVPIGASVTPEKVSAPYEFFGKVADDIDTGNPPFILTSKNHPSILYYDLDEGKGSEALTFTVNSTNLEINKSSFSYSTSWYEKDGLNYIAWLGEPYYVVENKADWYLSKVLLDEEVDDTHLLRVGESLALPSGFALTPLEIDVDGGEAWISVTQDGEEVESSVTKETEMFSYEADLNESGDDDNWVLTFTIETVFAGMNTNLVKINTVQLISPDPILIETPDDDTMSGFNIKSVSPYKTITIDIDSDDDEISLKKDGIVGFMNDRFWFRINEEGDVGGLVVKITEPGIYELFAEVSDVIDTGNPPFTLTSKNHPSILYYDLDEGKGSEALALTVNSTNLEINKSSFSYSTSWYEKDGLNYIAWLGEPYYVVENKADWYLSKVLLDEEVDDTHLLRVGESLTLPGGFALTPLEIDVDGGEAWISVTQDGEEVESSVANEGGKFSYEADLNESGDDDNWVLTFNIETVFAGMNTNLVKINTVQLISPDPILIETPDDDTMSGFDIKSVSPYTTITIDIDSDDDEISLKKDGIVGFMNDRFNFKINEDGNIGGICKVVEVGGEGATPTETEPGVTDTEPGENVTVAGTGTEPGATDTEVVETPEPTETEKEPGFEAVFAIAGLLAVAYLVLRKRE